MHVYSLKFLLIYTIYLPHVLGMLLCIMHEVVLVLMLVVLVSLVLGGGMRSRGMGFGKECNWGVGGVR